MLAYAVGSSACFAFRFGPTISDTQMMAFRIKFWCVKTNICVAERVGRHSDVCTGRLPMVRVPGPLSAARQFVLNVFQGPRGDSSGVRLSCCLVLRSRVGFYGFFLPAGPSNSELACAATLEASSCYSTPQFGKYHRSAPMQPTYAPALT